MKNITFFDIEIEPNKKEILDIGGIIVTNGDVHGLSHGQNDKISEPWCQVQWFFL